MATIRVVATMVAKQGCDDEFVRRWLPHEAACRAQPGCLQYELHRSATDPGRFVLMELWRDEEAYRAHWALEVEEDLYWEDVLVDDEVEFYSPKAVYTLNASNEWVEL